MLKKLLLSRSFASLKNFSVLIVIYVAYPSCRSSSLLGATGRKLVLLSNSSSSLSAFNISFLEKNPSAPQSFTSRCILTYL
jgi:hypothetical protein